MAKVKDFGKTATVEMSEYEKEKYEVFTENFATFKEKALNLCRGDVFLFEGDLFIKGRLGFATKAGNFFPSVRFSYRFNPEVVEIYSSSY